MSTPVSAPASPPAGSLREMLDQYVAMRRRLGYKFQHQGRMLTAFVEYLEQRGETTITVASALAWVTAPEGASICYQRQRLSAVRGFARHLAAFDPACQVPPARLLPAAPAPVPYLYSPQEISALIHAAGTLAVPLQAATYQAMISLLAVTGLRTGEALALDVADVDMDAALITVRGKYDRTRLVPLHPTTVTMLRGYRARCGQLCPAPASPSFFLSATGTRPFPSAVHATFARLLARAGINDRHGRPPRMHDLRHYADGWVMCPA